MKKQNTGKHPLGKPASRPVKVTHAPKPKIHRPRPR